MSAVRAISPVFFFFCYITLAVGQQVAPEADKTWQGITASFQSGDARSLASYFDTMVDLGLPEKDNSYSKSQGEIVMRDFFKKFPPDTFKVLQKGNTSESSHFAICQYKSGTNIYQVSVYLRKEDHSYRITKIKFETLES